MRALVTGAAGFIGSHLVDGLLDVGDEVVAVDHLQRKDGANLAAAAERGASVVKGEVTDVAAMTRLVADLRPHVIYHLAAQIDVRRSVADPSTDAHVNVGGTAAVLQAARAAGTRRVVLASTAGVYGTPAQLPTPEDAPVAPLSPYGASKAAAETYMSLFQRLHGVSTLALRMSNVYGPRQDPRGESGVVAIFAGGAREGREVIVYGEGTQTRDLVYVEDVVAAFIAGGRASVLGVANVSTGVETSVNELAVLLGVQTRRAPPRRGEVERSCLLPRRASELLGWRARTPLSTGLRETVARIAASPR